MWWLDPIELVFVAGSVGACIGGFIMGVCSSMRMSRCRTISICFGCASCERENLTEEEYKEELQNQQQIQHANQQVGHQEAVEV